jgi:hypothetical protein
MSTDGVRYASPRAAAPALLSRPISAITPADVYELVLEHLSETDTLEFKERLPTKKGDVDSWESRLEIRDHSRNEILDEVIAFANAYGGHVILGIRESDDRPRRGVDIAPIAHCDDLAERLRQQARDCVDPQLPAIEITGIPLREDGAGVVVIRVPESRLAPHRLKGTLKSHRRHADRCEPMTMREIQDLTLQRAAGVASLETAFAERRAGFMKALQVAWELGIPGNPNQPLGPIGVRATAIPSSSLNVPRDYLAKFQPYLSTFIVGDSANIFHDVRLPPNNFVSRPIVRGRRFVADYGRRGNALSIDVKEDGFVEYQFTEPTGENLEEDFLISEWVLAIVANALATAHALRLAAGASGTEYVLELEIRRERGDVLKISQLGGGVRYSTAVIDPNPLVFPRYSVGEFDDIPNVVGLVASDLFNAAGWLCEPSTYRLVGPPPTLERARLGIPIGQ